MDRIESVQNPLVKRLASLVRSSRARAEEKEIVIEGRSLILEVSKQLIIKNLLTIDEAPASVKPEKIWQVEERVLEKISTSRTPPKMIASLKIPDEISLNQKNPLLALDQTQDPGNVGTLFRTAYALGFEGIYLIKPHVDPFNDKAMRAAKGANLFLPFQSVELESFLELSKGYRLLLASADGQPLVKDEKPTILVLGHETRGVSAALMERGERVAIPMRKEAESLNVASAGAILMDRIMHG